MARASLTQNIVRMNAFVNMFTQRKKKKFDKVMKKTEVSTRTGDKRCARLCVMSNRRWHVDIATMV